MLDQPWPKQYPIVPLVYVFVTFAAAEPLSETQREKTVRPSSYRDIFLFLLLLGLEMFGRRKDTKLEHINCCCREEEEESVTLQPVLFSIDQAAVTNEC